MEVGFAWLFGQYTAFAHSRVFLQSVHYTLLSWPVQYKHSKLVVRTKLNGTLVRLLLTGYGLMLRL